MALKVINNKIIISRGNTGVIDFPLERDSYPPVPYELRDGDICTFTIRKEPKSLEEDNEEDIDKKDKKDKKEYKENDKNDKNPILVQKILDGIKLSLLSEDTIKLNYGQYWYDVELKNDNDNIKFTTVIGEFIVSEVVT